MLKRANDNLKELSDIKRNSCFDEIPETMKDLNEIRSNIRSAVDVCQSSLGSLAKNIPLKDLNQNAQ